MIKSIPKREFVSNRKTRILILITGINRPEELQNAKNF
jgi:hypothetical protein